MAIDNPMLGGYMAGQQVAFQRELQPYQLESAKLGVAQQRQSMELAQQKMNLAEYAQQQKQKEIQSAELEDLGQAAAWADTPEKWEQAISFYEQQGYDVDQFRGRFDMRDMLMKLQNSDFAQQQKVLEGVSEVISQLPPERQQAAKSIAKIDPKGVVDYAKETLLPKAKQEGDLKASDIRSINTDITKIAKTANDKIEAAKDLKSLESANTGPAQLAMIFKFMNALDPASVVREGEQVMVQKSGGIFDYMKSYVDRLNTGAALSPDTVREIVNTAEMLASGSVESANESIDEYLNTFDEFLTPAQKERFQARKVDAYGEAQEIQKPGSVRQEVWDRMTPEQKQVFK